jgi:hypothetical protein
MNASGSAAKANLISLNTRGKFVVRIEILTGLRYGPKIYPELAGEFIKEHFWQEIHTEVKAIDGVKTSSRTIVK